MIVAASACPWAIPPQKIDSKRPPVILHEPRMKPSNIASLPGTIDGATGWYKDAFSRVIQYAVLGDGTWEAIDQYDFVLPEGIMRACPGSIQGESGWYIDCEDEFHYFCTSGTTWRKVDPQSFRAAQGTVQGAQGVYIDPSGNEFYCGKTDEKWHIWPRFELSKSGNASSDFCSAGPPDASWPRHKIGISVQSATPNILNSSAKNVGVINVGERSQKSLHSLGGSRRGPRWSENNDSGSLISDDSDSPRFSPRAGVGSYQYRRDGRPGRSFEEDLVESEPVSSGAGRFRDSHRQTNSGGDIPAFSRQYRDNSRLQAVDSGGSDSHHNLYANDMALAASGSPSRVVRVQPRNSFPEPVVFAQRKDVDSSWTADDRSRNNVLPKSDAQHISSLGWVRFKPAAVIPGEEETSEWSSTPRSRPSSSGRPASESRGRAVSGNVGISTDCSAFNDEPNPVRSPLRLDSAKPIGAESPGGEHWGRERDLARNWVRDKGYDEERERERERERNRERERSAADHRDSFLGNSSGKIALGVLLSNREAADVVPITNSREREREQFGGVLSNSQYVKSSRDQKYADVNEQDCKNDQQYSLNRQESSSDRSRRRQSSGSGQEEEAGVHIFRSKDSYICNDEDGRSDASIVRPKSMSSSGDMRVSSSSLKASISERSIDEERRVGKSDYDSRRTSSRESCGSGRGSHDRDQYSDFRGGRCGDSRETAVLGEREGVRNRGGGGSSYEEPPCHPIKMDNGVKTLTLSSSFRSDISGGSAISSPCGDNLDEEGQRTLDIIIKGQFAYTRRVLEALASGNSSRLRRMVRQARKYGTITRIRNGGGSVLVSSTSGSTSRSIQTGEVLWFDANSVDLSTFKGEMQAGDEVSFLVTADGRAASVQRLTR